MQALRSAIDSAEWETRDEASLGSKPYERSAQSDPNSKMWVWAASNAFEGWSMG